MAVWFNWPGGVPATGEHRRHVLVLDFARAPDVDVSRFAIDMPRYVALARVENDGKTLRVALKANFTLHAEGRELALCRSVAAGLESGPPPLPADVLAVLLPPKKRARLRRRKRGEARGISDPKSGQPGMRSALAGMKLLRLVFDWSDPVLWVVRKDRCHHHL